MALIFAMLRVKPSPFCLMDEIDAALDEANVGRFVDVLQGFAKESQFIIVTHNPHTIQAADVLFGVTMEDAGVSRIIKLELREWEDFLADAEQKVAAVRAPRAGTRVLPTQT
jgi:chromosome segregation protein